MPLLNTCLAEEVPPIEGTLAKTNRENSNEEPLTMSPLLHLAFKIATDPFVGKLTFFRVYSGKLKIRQLRFNSVKSKKERIGRMVQMHSNNPRRDQGSSGR